MIYYSIIPLEVVLKGENPFDNNNTSRIISYQGCQVEVASTTGGQMQIQRVISTSPKDYLNPKLQPGATIDILK